MIVYKENIAFPGHVYLLALFVGIFLYFVYISSLQLSKHILAETYGPVYFNLLMAFLMLIFSILIFQFRYLEIIISDKTIIVRYGIFKREIFLSAIEEAYLDNANEFWSYGGWGIRNGKVNGKKRLVYNLPSKNRIVLPLKNKNHEFVFSTNAPEKVLMALKP